MSPQLITYRGRIVAVATRTGFFLTERLANRPETDAERTFVIYLCAYAGDVLSGVLPGPYTEELARLYALACLVPAELLERPDLAVARAAAALQGPEHELRAALPPGVADRG
jgi:hypothetical protein